MTSVLDRTTTTRTTPSPVPLTERSVPRDTTGNIWVQAPDPAVFALLTGHEHARPAGSHRRRPSPERRRP